VTYYSWAVLTGICWWSANSAWKIHSCYTKPKTWDGDTTAIRGAKVFFFSQTKTVHKPQWQSDSFAMRLINQQHKKMLLSMDREEHPLQTYQKIPFRTISFLSLWHYCSSRWCYPLSWGWWLLAIQPQWHFFCTPVRTDSGTAIIIELQEQLPAVNQVRQQLVQQHLEQAANALVQSIHQHDKQHGDDWTIMTENMGMTSYSTQQQYQKRYTIPKEILVGLRWPLCCLVQLVIEGALSAI